MISLPGILAEVLGVKTPPAKKCARLIFGSWQSLGPELEILRRQPLDALAREGGSSWPTALTGCAGVRCTSMGATTALIGEIRLFTPAERSTLLGHG